MKTASLLLLVGLVAGCHTYDVNGARPVRYAAGVQVVALDTVARPVRSSAQIYETAAEVHQPFHKIALLTRSGHREDEGLIWNAFAWRARQIGADAIVILPAAAGWPDYQFRADAIVYDSPTNTP